MAAGRPPSFWARRGAVAILLLPLSGLFALLAALRRAAFRHGLLRLRRAGRPVIVVGNVAVGGSGKTPVVIWLVEQLRRAGHRPAIVSRGYGRATRDIRLVEEASPVREVGDEPVLIARLTGCPMVVGADRPAAIDHLLQAFPDCTVIVSDDGMQHYRMARDVEIAVVDERVLGNRWLLPAGPLREPLRRLRQAGLVVFNGPASAGLRAGIGGVPSFDMRLEAGAARRLDGAATRQLAEWRGQRVHAVAGIGRPERFFEMLRGFGLDPMPHAFGDHYDFVAGDLAFDAAAPILMTSKDAVKCRPFAPADCWEVPVTACIDDGAFETIVETLAHGQPPA